MATLIRRRGSPFWYARYRYKGRDVTRSTETGNRRDAEATLKRWVSEDRGENNTERKFAEVLAELNRAERESSNDPVEMQVLQDRRRRMAADLLQGSGQRLALDDAWLAWEHSPRRRDPGETTVAQYRAIWNRFHSWTTRRKLVGVHEITPTQADDYAANLKAEGFASSTYNAHIKFLRSFFKTLRQRAGLLILPFVEIPTVDLVQESRRELTADELKTVVQKAGGSLRLMIAIGLFTGLRLGDVCRLRWADIDLEKGILRTKPSKTARRGKWITVPLHATLAEMLRQWRGVQDATQEFVLPDEAAEYERQPAGPSRRIQTHFLGCGITTTERMKGRKKAVVRVGFHSLRHSFVSLCAAAGVPQHVVQTLVGHGSPAMTEHYTHVDAEQKRKAIAALPAVDIDPAPQAEKPQ